METIRTTCPRDCYDSCGLLVSLEGGVVTRVRGDPEHPVNRGGICFKCGAAYNHELLDHDRRLTEPQKRVGAKGTGSFEPISWATALAEIADRLKAICNTSGADTILNTHYTGTISLLAFLYPMRFFNRLGATEVNPDTICNLAARGSTSGPSSTAP